MKIEPYSGVSLAPLGVRNKPYKPCLNGRPQLPARQRGVVLFIALIALVAMTLAAIALVRSVDTGNVVAGNLAFKQGATLAGDTAAETAIAWLIPVSATASAYNDQPASGYYATSQDNLDMTGSLNAPTMALVDWDLNGCAGTTPAACIVPAPTQAAGNGYTFNFIIHRLCQTSGDPNSSSNTCATYQAPSTSSPNRGEIKYGGGRLQQPPTSYYRITSRVRGPRNSISFIEEIVHF